MESKAPPAGMRGKWLLLGIAAILAGAAVGAFTLRHRKAQPQAASAARPAHPASTAPITLTGKIRAAHVTGVAAEVSGNIEAFLADVGQEVYRGEELARIGGAGLESERAAAEAAVETAQQRVEDAQKAVTAAQLEASRAGADAQRARVELERASKVYDRQKVLFSAGATPRLTYEKAQSDFQNAQEQWTAVEKAARGSTERVADAVRAVENAKQMLADKSRQFENAQDALAAAVVTAPVDGLVVARKGEIGEPAQQFGNELFQIGTDLVDLEVTVEPPPEILKRLHPGEAALVMVPDLQSGAMTGEVKKIEGSAVVVGFASSLPAIRPGMLAGVRLGIQ